MALNNNGPLSTINAGTLGAVTLNPFTTSQLIDVGGRRCGGPLGIDDNELGEITAGAVRVGSFTAGNLRVGGTITRHAGFSVLDLITGGAISQSAGLSVANLALASAAGITLTDAGNSIDTLAVANLGGAVNIANTGPLTIGTVNGLVGFSNTGTTTTITAASPLTIAANSSSTGSTTLTASETVPAAPGDDLTIDSGVTVNVSAGDLFLLAGDDVVLQSGAQATAADRVDVNAAFGDNDGAGGIDSHGSVSGNLVSFAALNDIEVGQISATTAALLTTTAGAIADSNTTGADITAATLSMSAATGIGTAADPIETQVGSLEAQTSTGGIFIANNLNVPAQTLIIGGVSGLSGVQVTGASGDISLLNHGTIDILTDGDTVRGSGNITIQAQGAGADIVTGGQSADTSIRGLASGLVSLQASQDIQLGDAAGFGSVRSVSGSIALQAGHNVVVTANAVVNVIGGTGQKSVVAGGNITMLTSPGALAGAPEFSTAGGAITLSAGVGHAITADSTGTDAVASGGGIIDLLADDMVLNKGIDATSTGTVFLQPQGAGVTVGIATGAGALGLSNAELNEVTARNLDIGNLTAGKITVGGTVAPLLATNVELQTGAGIELTAGASLTALGSLDLLAGGNVTLDAGASLTGPSQILITFGGDGLGDTADLSAGTLTSPNIDVVGGTGNDTVKVAHGGGEFVDGAAGINTAVFSGNVADYTRTLNPDGSWTVTDIRPGSPDGTDTLIRVQILQFANGIIPVVPIVHIDPIAGDDVLNQAEAGAPVLVSGTTINVPDGQIVTLSISGLAPISVPVTGGHWSVTLTSAQAQSLADGSHTATATVSVPAGTATLSRPFLVDETLPTLVNDTHGIVATSGSFTVPAAQGMLSNDTDPNADPLTVTGVSDASQGSVSPTTPLAGQFGVLTMGTDGSYSYAVTNAAGLAEGRIGHDVFTYVATDHNGNSSSATLDVQVTGHTAGIMDQEAYTATESVTGDMIFGALYDNTGRYTVGSSVNTGPDDAGGSWTYSITGITQADAGHQDASYSGFAYDYDYQDTGVGTFATFYGSTGFAHGVNDKVNFSGNNYLGSDGDLVTINGQFFGIASGHYVVPEGITTTTAAPVMQQDTFAAVESVTGDVIFGVLFDNTNRYSIGSSVTAPGVDNAGGSWTYTIANISDADAAHQNAALSGFVYDVSYFDADQNQMFSTFYGSKGVASSDRTTNFSGNNYLASDGDLAMVGNRNLAMASGKYVLPDPLPPAANPPTLGFQESSGGPTTGSGGADMTLLNNMAAGFDTSGGSGGAPLTSPPAGGTDTLLTSPHPG